VRHLCLLIPKFIISYSESVSRSRPHIVANDSVLLIQAFHGLASASVRISVSASPTLPTHVSSYPFSRDVVRVNLCDCHIDNFEIVWFCPRTV